MRGVLPRVRQDLRRDEQHEGMTQGRQGAARNRSRPLANLADDHFELDITRACTLIGWAPKHSLRETLPKMVAALKADPEKFYCDNKLERCDPEAKHDEKE